ncbi:MAG: protein disulfide isomerase family protein [Bacteroidales bacterium]|nr:protein disulfide isomerase family protein [Bacteroidales bacterium]MDD2425285.1 protein disulfide isomerase family protein [Bacteroidales bacterium]MDD3989661.1 protein disulfide isomerase family protein [Bacteroidales bacterium]
MKKLILLCIPLTFVVNLYSQGITFRDKKFDEVISIAKKENKAIFIDIYTSWCAPCKALAKEVFPQTAVGEFFNSNFICFKADAEKTDDGKMIAKKYGVTAYPTLLFVNGNGELVYKFLGYRDEKGLLKEGEKAVIAYTLYPEIQKLKSRYETGENSREFLNEYLIKLDKCGLDGGMVLNEYLNTLNDIEIIDSLNVSRIEKINLYDRELTTRLINLAIKISKEKNLSKKDENKFNRAIGKSMSSCLTSAAKSGNSYEFEDILYLKELFFSIPANKNSIASASLGGGNIYVPSHLLRLDFYSSQKKWDKFTAFFDKYIDTLKLEYLKTNGIKEMLEKGLKEKYDAAVLSGNKEEMKSIKSTSEMMKIFTGMDSYYISANMINHLEKYFTFAVSQKDETFVNKVEEFYLFLNDFYPSCKNSVYIVEKLKEIGKNRSAADVLKIALAKGQNAIQVTADDIAKCKEMLSELSIYQ